MRGLSGSCSTLARRRCTCTFDEPGVGFVVVAPDLLEQHLAGENLLRLRGEREQQLELERREVDPRAPALHLVPGDIDHEVTDRDRVAATDGVGRSRVRMRRRALWG